MSKEAPQRGAQKQGSLAWLEEIYFNEGREAASEKFRAHLPPAVGKPYHLIKPNQGLPTHRTDVESKRDGITYESYNPPPFWEAPYAILKAQFENVPKKDFMFHAGEEILVPISGQVHYHFYANDEAKRPSIIEPKPVKPGSIIGLNPQAPHHTWGGKNGASAWMIFRHLSDTATAINMTSPLAVTDLHSTPRRISLEKLQEPGVYALVSWGIAEKIRLYRARAGCRISQLADACRLDPSHVSRIENAEANPSLDSLVRIARFLRIGLEELIAPLPWVYKTVDIQQSKKITKPSHQPVSVQPVDPTHQLHPSLLEIPGGQAVSLPPKNLSQISKVEPICISSCIVLEGRAIFEPPDGADAELLESGCVLHFWRAVEGRFQALQDTRILQIICANSCACGAEENEKR